VSSVDFLYRYAAFSNLAFKVIELRLARCATPESERRFGDHKEHDASLGRMDNYYSFFDRSAVDSLRSLSWQEFLRLYGTSRWAKGAYTDDGSASLRGLIAFSVDSGPSEAEVEEIIRHRTLRWTIQRSSPQYFVMGEIVYDVPRLRKSYASLDIWSNDSTVLLAAAAEGYFRGEVTASAFKSVLKLHYSKFEDFIRLSKRERSVVRGLMDVDQYAKPIYPWQGETGILDEEWLVALA
jgi:hypothetical protein